MRRALISLLVVASVAAACSGDDGDAGDAAPAPAPAPDPTDPTSTSTTEPPIELIPCPEGLDVVAAADLDGDGTTEDLLLAGRPGGRVFFACGPDGGRPLDLDAGAWYLAVDAGAGEGGVDRVLLGAADIGDHPERPAAVWFAVDASGRELALVPAPDFTPDVDQADAPIRVPPSPAVCDEAQSIRDADVDGDGSVDIVGQAFRDSPVGPGPSIVVCTARGEADEARVGGMGEIFAVSTATGDRPTIWSGGTTASAAFLDPYVWVDGRIVPIEDGGGPLDFTDGVVDEGEVAAYGCGDLDGNGIVELVGIQGTVADEGLLWVRRSWETQGAVATIVTDDGGVIVGATVDDPAVFGDLVPPVEDCAFGDVID